MKLTPNYLEYFISPVTGKFYHISQLINLTDGHIWVGDSANRPVETNNFVKFSGASSVVGNIAIFSDTDGHVIQDSGANIPDLSGLVEEAKSAAETATNAANTATTQADIATDKASLAITAATESSASATLSASYKTLAEGYASAASESAGLAGGSAIVAAEAAESAQGNAHESEVSAVAAKDRADEAATYRDDAHAYSIIAQAASTSALDSKNTCEAILAQLYSTGIDLVGDIIGSGPLNFPISTRLNLTLDQIPFAANSLNMSSQKIINLVAGSSANDAVNYSQLSGTVANYLLKANNLSDLSSISTARTNLGLTQIATQTVTQYAALAGGASNSIVSIGPGQVGQILRSTGTTSNPAYSTAKYPDTTTANQILYSSLANSISGLSTQNSAVLITDSSGVPQFSGTMTNGQIIIGKTGDIPIAATLTAGSGVTIVNAANSITISATGSGGTVTSVSGTTNRITSTGGTTPVIDISASYVGQTSITTLGTITTGTWNGTVIDIARGGNNTSSQITNGILYNNGTANTTSSGFTYNGTNLTIPGNLICLGSKIIYVSSINGSDSSGNGEITAPYSTIAYALSQITTATSSNPFCISLQCGSYSESSLVLKPNVSILGNGSKVTVSTDITLDSSFLTNESYSFIRGIRFAIGTHSLLLSLSTKSAVLTVISLENIDCVLANGFVITGTSHTSVASRATLLKMRNCFFDTAGLQTTTTRSLTLTNFNAQIENCYLDTFSIENSSSTLASGTVCNISASLIASSLTLKASGTMSLITRISNMATMPPTLTIDGINSILKMYSAMDVVPTLLNSAIFNPASFFCGVVKTTDTTSSTSTTTGSMVAGGGLGIGENLYVGGTANLTGALNLGTNGITGVTTNSSAVSGSVGEYISGSATSVSMSNGVAKNITTISLTAGDWDVWGAVQFSAGGTMTVVAGSLGTTSATLNNSSTAFTQINLSGFTAGGLQAVSVGTLRVSIASTTTVYLVGQSNFSSSTVNANGYIGARRVR